MDFNCLRPCLGLLYSSLGYLSRFKLTSDYGYESPRCPSFAASSRGTALEQHFPHLAAHQHPARVTHHLNMRSQHERRLHSKSTPTVRMMKQKRQFITKSESESTEHVVCVWCNGRYNLNPAQGTLQSRAFLDQAVCCWLM